ncbi:adenylyltransferase/cytidyltransferase family protein [Edaphobacter modestus]|uniref:Glycerol-3-phosphate cytidylyltransferase n=1 Tax=Edaphobacter modestus TaxID=388466 RepID=A0A4Q7YFV5_9BACT|nr:adenylyltransferase/cytidyltransferase family protein [Edaphobacter modestus]RZU35654.1 glycerol-3-phosphate cytidylyltransferase [Edaphobacter modestus]
MIRIGYAPGAYDLFHVGHLNLLRQAKEHCDFLIAGVVADDVLTRHKEVTPVVPLAERLEIIRSVRFVDAALPAMTNDKVEIWKDLRFNVLFKGNDWQGTEKGNKLERDFAALGVEVVYSPTHSPLRALHAAASCETSSSSPQSLATGPSPDCAE